MAYFDKPIFEDDDIHIGEIIISPGITDIPKKDRQILLDQAVLTMNKPETILILKQIIGGKESGVLCPINVNLTSNFINGHGRLAHTKYANFDSIAKRIANTPYLKEHKTELRIGQNIAGFIGTGSFTYLCSLASIHLGGYGNPAIKDVLESLIDGQKVFTSVGWYSGAHQTGIYCSHENCKKLTGRFWEYNNGKNPAKHLTCQNCYTKDLKSPISISDISVKTTLQNVLVGMAIHRTIIMILDEELREISYCNTAADGLNAPTIGYVYAKSKKQENFDHEMMFLSKGSISEGKWIYEDSESVITDFTFNPPKQPKLELLMELEDPKEIIVKIKEETTMSDININTISTEELQAELVSRKQGTTSTIDKRFIDIQNVIIEAHQKLAKSMPELFPLGTDAESIALNPGHALSQTIRGYMAKIESLTKELTDSKQETNLDTLAAIKADEVIDNMMRAEEALKGNPIAIQKLADKKVVDDALAKVLADKAVQDKITADALAKLGMKPEPENGTGTNPNDGAEIIPKQATDQNLGTDSERLVRHMVPSQRKNGPILF